jgi:hypothetical protein
MTSWAIGDSHPIAALVLQLAEGNMSLASKQAIVSKQQAIDLAIAEQTLEQERSAERNSLKERADKIALERQKLTPLPERVWALRNVAANLALGNQSSRNKAKEFLIKALELQTAHLGQGLHPGKLGVLWGFCSALLLMSAWGGKC